MKTSRIRSLFQSVACVALVLLQLKPALASETWYRWTDSQGTPQLESHPPALGISYEQVAVPNSIQWAGRPDIPAAITDGSNRSVKNFLRQTSESVYPVVLGASMAPEAAEAISGSAVAISEHQLLTSCRVAEPSGRSLFIGIDGANDLVRAELVARDYLSDRCVISVHDARLRPVAGVRRFDTLELGEPLYSVSDPVQRSLSGGELSGFEAAGRTRYLHTTAAISSSSSGSGLFDRHGNLIGVITIIWSDFQFVEVAIPAEDFWK
jgi:S1-C subfamily serine protease